MVRFHPLITVLCQHKVDFVLIGGMAAVAQGSSYLTRDIDVCYAREEPNLQRLASALGPFAPRLRDAPPGLPFVLDVPTLRAGCNFTLTTSAGDLDIFGEVAGLGGYNTVNQYAESLEVEGLPCRVLTLEGLILSKKAAARPKDAGLLAELEALQALRKTRGREE